MQVSIENLEGLERRMTVQIPSDHRHPGSREENLKDLIKTVRKLMASDRARCH